MKTYLLHPICFFYLLFQVIATYGQSYNAGYGSGTGGFENVHVGAYTGAISTGHFNSFLGHRAGESNKYGGNYNSFLGYQAGRYNTTGQWNSFVGATAGTYNTTGQFNSFIGSGAGYTNTTGSSNSFIGSQAGFSNTTGSNNSFLGYQAGHYNTTGKFNSFVGSMAGLLNTTGSSNSFIGYEAGNRNKTGYHNSFVGTAAGFSNTTGYYNSFVGSYSGYFNTTGSNNSFMGVEAGFYNTTGSFNSNVGIRAGVGNTTGSYNCFMGYEAGSGNIVGNWNTALGYAAGFSSTNLTNATAIGHRAFVGASNCLVLGSINGVNGATSNTTVGIGLTNPDTRYLLHVNGQAAKPGGGAWAAASDKRLKREIKAFNDGLEVLKQIRPVKFKYNGKADLPTDKEFVGVIAQEVQLVAPYMIGKFTHQDKTGQQEEYLDYDASALPYILVNAIKELAKENEQLKIKVTELESLKGELTAIKALLEKQTTKQPTQESMSEAYLWQNRPNPTNGSTVIRYSIPQGSFGANLKLYTLTGQELQTFDLSGKKEGEVTLQAEQFPTGTYVYSLFVNGKRVDSKKLVLSK